MNINSPHVTWERMQMSLALGLCETSDVSNVNNAKELSL